MGLFEKIFPRQRRPSGQESVFETFTAYAPAMTTWNGQLYEQGIVRAAIDARSRHISKLRIIIEGSAKPKLQTRLRQAPNEFMTWPQFLYRLNTIRDMQNTAFIAPVYNEYGEKTGVFPILPSRCEIVEYGGEPWLRYEFSSGKKGALPFHEVGIMTKHQYRNDLFGEPNSAMKETMELLGIQNKGVSEAVKNSNTFRFIAQKDNFAAPDDLAEERKMFTRKNLEADGGGLLLFPHNYKNIKQIEAKPYTVDAKTLEIIQTNVFYYYGVNEKILKNIATGDEWASFYEGCVEEFAVQLSEVLTRMLFTPTERSHGARVFATANRLQYMSNADKVNVSKEMGDRGQMMIDEIREIWNLPPLPDGLGRCITLRGEYYLMDESGKIIKKGEANAQKTQEEPEEKTPTTETKEGENDAESE